MDITDHSVTTVDKPYAAKQLLWRVGIPILLALLTLCLTIYAYPLLPNKIPTHFGAWGMPDAWSLKTTKLFYSPAVVQWSMTLLLAGLTTLFALTGDIRGKINLPRKTAERLNSEQLGKLRKAVVNGMTGINIVTTAMLAFIQYGTVQTATGQWSGLGPFIWLFFLAVVFSTAVMLVNIFRAVHGNKK